MRQHDLLALSAMEAARRASDGTVAAVEAAAAGAAADPAVVAAATAALRQQAVVAEYVRQGPARAAAGQVRDACVGAARAAAAGGGDGGSREAAFELLLDLATHDSGCWREAQGLLTTLVHPTALQLLGLAFTNLPLQAVRPPG